MSDRPRVDERAEWIALAEHAAVLKGRHLRELFADDATRGTRLTICVSCLPMMRRGVPD